MRKKKSVTLGQKVSFIDKEDSKVVEGVVDAITVSVTCLNGNTYAKNIGALFNNEETAKVELRARLNKEINQNKALLRVLQYQLDNVK